MTTFNYGSNTVPRDIAAWAMQNEYDIFALAPDCFKLVCWHCGTVPGMRDATEAMVREHIGRRPVNVCVTDRRTLDRVRDLIRDFDENPAVGVSDVLEGIAGLVSLTTPGCQDWYPPAPPGYVPPRPWGMSRAPY